MADHAGVRDAIESLAALLREHITNSDEAELTGIPVRLDSPRELELANIATAVSVWLHRVDVQPDLMNRPPERPDPHHEAHRSLPVELAVHVTPVSTDPAGRLLLLGRILQVVSDHRQLVGSQLSGSLATSGGALRLTLDLFGPYELNLLWAGQQTHMRPGVSLKVTGLVIDTHLPLSRSRLVHHVGGSIVPILGGGA